MPSLRQNRRCRCRWRYAPHHGQDGFTNKAFWCADDRRRMGKRSPRSGQSVPGVGICQTTRLSQARSFAGWCPNTRGRAANQLVVDRQHPIRRRAKAGRKAPAAQPATLRERRQHSSEVIKQQPTWLNRASPACNSTIAVANNSSCVASQVTTLSESSTITRQTFSGDRARLAGKRVSTNR